MIRTDVPMDSIHRVRESLETLDRLIDEGQECIRCLECGKPGCPFIRTILLGIMARLDAAIVEINGS